MLRPPLSRPVQTDAPLSKGCRERFAKTTNAAWTTNGLDSVKLNYRIDDGKSISFGKEERQ
jgi:hypothetical protein